MDTDADYTPDTEVIVGRRFQESTFRSAPYFDLRIDGITLLDEATAKLLNIPPCGLPSGSPVSPYVASPRFFTVRYPENFGFTWCPADYGKIHCVLVRTFGRTANPAPAEEERVTALATAICG